MPQAKQIVPREIEQFLQFSQTAGGRLSFGPAFSRCSPRCRCRGCFRRLGFPAPNIAAWLLRTTSGPSGRLLWGRGLLEHGDRHAEGHEEASVELDGLSCRLVGLEDDEGGAGGSARGLVLQDADALRLPAESEGRGQWKMSPDRSDGRHRGSREKKR